MSHAFLTVNFRSFALLMRDTSGCILKSRSIRIYSDGIVTVRYFACYKERGTDTRTRDDSRSVLGSIMIHASWFYFLFRYFSDEAVTNRRVLLLISSHLLSSLFFLGTDKACNAYFSRVSPSLYANSRDSLQPPTSSWKISPGLFRTFRARAIVGRDSRIDSDDVSLLQSRE